MRSFSVVVAFVMLAAGHSSPVAARATVAETCQGQPATVVAPNDQGVITGTAGDDVIVASGLVAIRAEGGDDTICLSGHLRVAREDGDNASVDGGDGEDTLEVRASQEKDVLDTYAVERLDAWMGDGYDVLVVTGDLHGSGVLDGGAGRGALKIGDGSGVAVDLAARQLTTTSGSGSYRLTRFRRLAAHAPRVTLAGDARSNTLSGVGCRIEVRGRGGDDSLSGDDTSCSSARWIHLRGMRGDDRMVGSSRNDWLTGGLGLDRAAGRGGVDRCAAEMRRGCER